ncbi:MAG: ATP-binding protein [Magnetococcales bacterium]|nr:ATP-binding protein [Magnetococcales bacterium]
MDQALIIRSCRPVALTVFAIGPFQDKKFYLDFTNEKGEGCNYFFLISANGRGKTVLLEAMAALMSLLDSARYPLSPDERLWSHPDACAQLDLRLVVLMEGKVREILLTLAAGRGLPHDTRSWGVDDLARVETTEQLHISLSRSAGGKWERLCSHEPLLDELLALVQEEKKHVYESFGADPMLVPSLLYFDAYRDIPVVDDEERSVASPPEWYYYPLHRFGSHGDQWQHSLDNLLVWLTWLNDDRYNQAQKLINELVFTGTSKMLDGISRQYLHARVTDGGREHRLDQLSSGEKSLLLLILRIHLHLTSNSIILIDELDVHLHIKLQHRLYQALKRFVVANPQVTLIVTTHSRELIDQFTRDMAAGDPGVRYGGFLIEADDI